MNYSTSDGTAQAGANYTATSGAITFAAGDFAPRTINVPILEDTMDEANETFTVNLASPSNATPAPSSTTTPHRHSPSATPRNSKATAARAISGEDFAPANGSLLRPRGTTSRIITINILGDELVESTETFALDLTRPVSATADGPLPRHRRPPHDPQAR